MLEFTDRTRAVRVHRRDSATNTRVPIATINKVSLAVVVDNGMNLSEEERGSIQELIELINKSNVLERQVWAVRLPTYLREAIEYCASDATDIEVSQLATAVAQAHSRLNSIQIQRRAAKVV